MSNRIISNSGMMIASGLAMVLQNLAESRRREHLRKQEEIWEEAVLREQKFMAATQEMQTYEQMRDLFKPLKQECANLLKMQTRLTEVAGFFALFGVDPYEIINPNGGKVEEIANFIIDEALKKQEAEKRARNAHIEKLQKIVSNKNPAGRKVDRQTSIDLINQCRSNHLKIKTAVSISKAMKVNKLVKSLTINHEAKSKLLEKLSASSDVTPFSDAILSKQKLQAILV